MKKIIIFLTFVLIVISTFAQAPQKMSYQAVLRNAGNGLIVSAPIGMQISVLQGSLNGTIVYKETQTTSSNADGLVSLEIGTGSVVSGTFSSINWANGPYFIKTETDPSGGTNYTISSTSQLMSVPYALYAASSGGAVDLISDQSIAGKKIFTSDLTPKGRLMIPMGELSFFNYNSGHSMTITAQSTGANGTDNMIPINPQSTGKTVNFVNDMFTLNGFGSPISLAQSDSKLKYTSGDINNEFVGRYFHIALSFSFSPVLGNTGSSFVFGVSKNGEVQDSSKQFLKIGSNGDSQSSALHVLLWLDDGDEIGFSIGQLGGVGNVLIKSMNFVAIGM